MTARAVFDTNRGTCTTVEPTQQEGNEIIGEIMWIESIEGRRSFFFSCFLFHGQCCSLFRNAHVRFEEDSSGVFSPRVWCVVHYVGGAASSRCSLDYSDVVRRVSHLLLTTQERLYKRLWSLDAVCFVLRVFYIPNVVRSRCVTDFYSNIYPIRIILCPFKSKRGFITPVRYLINDNEIRRERFQFLFHYFSLRG